MHYLFAKYVDSCYKTISFLFVFLLESYFYDFNWLIQQRDVLQTHICKGWITASGLKIVKPLQQKQNSWMYIKTLWFHIICILRKNEQMMTWIQKEYFVGKHFDLWPGGLVCSFLTIYMWYQRIHTRTLSKWGRLW